MTLTVYTLKTCDTCRKAVKALSAAGHKLQLLDVRTDGVPKEKLEAYAEVLGWEVLLNTRSTTWRNLDVEQKTEMSQDKAVALICEFPSLMKRPLIDGKDVTVGWTKEVQSIWL